MLCSLLREDDARNATQAPGHSYSSHRLDVIHILCDALHHAESIHIVATQSLVRLAGASHYCRVPELSAHSIKVHWHLPPCKGFNANFGVRTQALLSMMLTPAIADTPTGRMSRHTTAWACFRLTTACTPAS